MSHQYLECEALIEIASRKDCADHRKLGWSKSEWHTHNRGQLIYAEYGIMRLYMGDQIFYIPSWHAAWIPQGVSHKLVTESQDLLFYTLYLDYHTLEHPFYKEVSIFPVNNMLREMIVYTKKWKLSKEPGVQEENFLNSIKYLLPEYARKKMHLHVPLPSDETLRAITSFIGENLDTKLKSITLSRKFGISERSMHRLFVRELGMSFIQFQKLTRMVKAVELLSIRGKTASEVAYEVGYESVPSFIRTFKEIIGESPSRLYRNMEANKD